MIDIVRTISYLAAAVLFCVSLAPPAQATAGQYSHLVAVVIATDDGREVVVPVDPVSLKAYPPLINRRLLPAARPLIRRASTTVVCGPDGCREVEVASPAGCPCDCPDCNCPATPATPAVPEKSIVVANHTAASHSAGPVRGLLGKVARFIVKGGPIRQALRSNRQARRGH